MTTLGVSVYPDLQSISEIEEYLALASANGFTRVFSSMWSVEGTKNEILVYFEHFVQIAHRNNMEVDLDVNPDLFEKLGADYDDISVFANLGVDILRMDVPYSMDKNKILINNPFHIKIEFNASISSELFNDQLNELASGKDLLVCHNFYPQPYTGMKWEKYLNINQNLKKAGMKVGVFVSSQNKNTVGVWDAKYGLPTIEKMRDLPLDTQIRTLLAAGNIDTILIGNACASEEEFKNIKEATKEIKADSSNPLIATLLKMGASLDHFQQQKKIRVNLDKNITENEKSILLDFFPHSDVGDSSEWIWRSRFPRFLNKDIPFRKHNQEVFPVGSVVIVNNNYKHYAGEVQIALRPLKNDGIRNLIGTLNEDEMEILKLVNDGDVVIFLQS